MEAEVITAGTNAVSNIDKMGIVGVLVLVIIMLFFDRRKDKTAQGIAERQVEATVKMAEVQKIHNDFMEKILSEHAEILREIRESQLRAEGARKRRSA
ncbi:MAG: hypothetical protein LBF71_02620 [Campylobacteraceae bacterium]|jgi:hypothetical protein|nr:hypothetical protein [Campylobacteraceae bacterium]